MTTPLEHLINKVNTRSVECKSASHIYFHDSALRNQVQYDKFYEQNRCLSKVGHVIHHRQRLVKFSRTNAFTKCPSDIIYEVNEYLNTP